MNREKHFKEVVEQLNKMFATKNVNIKDIEEGTDYKNLKIKRFVLAKWIHAESFVSIYLDNEIEDKTSQRATVNYGIEVLLDSGEYFDLLSIGDNIELENISGGVNLFVRYKHSSFKDYKVEIKNIDNE